MKRYFNDWNGIEGVWNDFRIGEGDVRDEEVLLASYSYEDYQGDALVVFARDGKLYEVNGNHCSCYGLEEGGWNPEETSVGALKMRLEQNYFYSMHGDDVVAALCVLVNLDQFN